MIKWFTKKVASILSLFFLITSYCLAQPTLDVSNTYISGRMKDLFVLTLNYPAFAPVNGADISVIDWYMTSGATLSPYTPIFAGGVGTTSTSGALTATKIATGTSKTFTIGTAQNNMYIYAVITPKNGSGTATSVLVVPWIYTDGGTVDHSSALQIIRYRVLPNTNQFSPCQGSNTGFIDEGQTTACSGVPITINKIGASDIGFNAAQSPYLLMDWGDGNTEEILADLLNPRETSQFFQQYGKINLAHTYNATVTPNPLNATEQCSYLRKLTRINVRCTSTLYCGSPASNSLDGQCTQTVSSTATIWDTEDNTRIGTFDVSKFSGIGVEPVGQALILEVCEKETGNFRLFDNSDFNCTPTREQSTRRNDKSRWVQWVYGTTGSTVTGVTVNGISYTNAQFPIYGPIEYLPSSVIDPNSQTPNLSFPNTIASPQTLKVTLRSWNACNPYDDFEFDGGLNEDNNGSISVITTSASNQVTASNSRNADNNFRTIVYNVNIITKPATPTYTLTNFCQQVTGTPTNAQYNIPISGAAGDYRVYSDAALSTLLITSTGVSANAFAFNPVTQGAPSSSRVNPATAGLYHRYVTLTTANGCVSDPLDLAFTINSPKTGGTVANAAGASGIHICSGTNPVAFTVSVTTGGGDGTLGNDIYQWQSSPDGSTWSDIGGATSDTFDPPALTVTTYYQRRVRESYFNITGNCDEAFSNIYQFIVDTPVQAGVIDNPQTLCSGVDNPSAMTNFTSGSGGNGTPSYTWQISTDNFVADINTIPLATSATYDPPSPLAVTTYYRRVNTSGVCVPLSAISNVIVMTVNQAVAPGSIGNAQIICSGDDPAILTSTLAPSGGNGSTYTFQWQESATGGGVGFAAASGANTGSTYDPPVLTATRFYRRQVTSGVCSATFSNEIQITVNPLPTASVTGGGSACNLTPAADVVFTFTGTAPFNAVIEVASTPDVPDITLTNYNSTTYSIVAPNPTVTTTYRVISLTDANTCSAAGAGLGGTASVTPQAVLPPSVDFFTAEAAVCEASPSSGTNPPDAFLDIQPNIPGQLYNLTYTLNGLTQPPLANVPGVVGATSARITISPTYVQMGSTPGSYQIIITAIQNVNTGCAGAVPIIGPNLIVNPRPATPTGAVQGVACSTAATGAPISVAAPLNGFTIVWSTTAAPTFTAAAGATGGTRGNTFTPTSNATATYHAFTRDDINPTNCLSAASLPVQHIQDVTPTTSNAGGIQSNCTGTFTLAGNAPNTGGGELGTWSVPGIFYQQNFSSYTNQTTSVAANGWSRNISAANVFAGNQGYFRVNGGQFELNDADGTTSGGAEVVWLSPVMTGTVTNLDISVNLSSAGTGVGDYLRIFYKLSGGAETLLTNGNQSGNFGTATATATGLNGTSIQLVIRANNNAATDFYRFDNILMSNAGAPTISNPNDRLATVTNLPVGSGAANTLTWTINSLYGVCTPSVSTVVLTRHPLPTVNNIAPSLCEDVFNGASTANVSLSNYDALVSDEPGFPVAIPSFTTVEYYSAASRLPGNQISAPTTIINGQIVYTLVRNSSTTCTSDGTITFTVRTLPAVTNHSVQICENSPPGSLIATGINLTTYEATITGGVANRDVEWYDDPGLAAGDLIPPGVISGAEQNYSTGVDVTLYAKVIDTASPTSPQCFRVATLNLDYQSRPGNNIISDALGNIIVNGVTGTPASGSTYTICASSNLILFQISAAINPGATYSWTIPPVSYAGEFNLLSTTNGIFVILTFPNSTSLPASLYSGGIPISVTETLGGACTGNTLTMKVRVEGSPPQPIILGPDYLCENELATFSIQNPVAGTYGWSLPPGATITSLPVTASSITVQMSTFSGNVNVTHASGNGCTSPAAVAHPVSISPRPSFTFTSNPLCSGANVSSAVTLTPNIIGTTFNWEILPGGISGLISGAAVGDLATGVTSISQTITNKSGVPATITYRVTPIGPDVDPTVALKFCSGNPQNVSVTIAPEPVIIPNQAKTICNNTTVGKEILLTPTNLPAGTTFTWPDPDGLGPLSAGSASMGVAGTIHINDVISNTSDSPLLVVYDVTPHNGVCDGTMEQVRITVEPTPKINTPVINNAPTLCSGGTPDFTFSTPTVPSNPSNLKFDVSLFTLPAGVTATGLASSGVTDVSASPSYQFTGGTLVNTNATFKTVVYRIVPKLNGAGCANGTAVFVNIDVEPTPTVSFTNFAAKVCDGGTPNFSINSTTAPSVPANLTFDIVPTIPAGIIATGNALNGALGVTQAALPFSLTGGTLDNTTDSKIPVTYEIIPKLAGCGVGTSQFVTVIVEPTPTANAPINNAPVICNGGTPNFSFTSPTIPNTQSDLTFDISVSAPLGVSGTGIAIAGVNGVTASSSLAYLFNAGTLTNTNNSKQIVTYTITPKLNGCVMGPTQTVDVVVQPSPVADVPVNSAPVICNGGTPNFSFTSPTVPNTVSDLTFDITLNTPIPAGVSGTGLAFSGVLGVTANATPFVFNSGTLTNSNDDFKTIVYTITPRLNGCSSGNIRTVSVKIEPTPKADIPVNNSPTICNGGSPNFQFTSPTIPNTQSDLTFDVAANLPLPAGVSGTGLSATGVSATAVTPYIFNTATLTNTNDHFEIVTFTITPRLAGCGVGPTRTVTVKVEPTPSASANNILPIICNGSSPNISITTLTVPTTPADLTFDVTIVTLNGMTGSGVAVNGIAGTTAPFFINSGVINNTSNSTKRVTYKIQPKLNGCANGAPVFVDVDVEPTPKAVVTNHLPRICTGDSPNIEITSPTTALGAVTFDVSVSLNGVIGTSDAGNGVTGATAPFFINTGTLTNPTSQFKTVTYTITPRLNGGCTNGTQQIVNVIVEPEPTVTLANNAPTVCNGGTPNILITSSTAPSNASDLKFNITANLPPGVTGTLLAGNGATGVSAPFSINTGTLSNSLNSFQTVEYVITPTLNGCTAGTPKSEFVKVEPTPQVDTPVNNSPVLCNNGSPDFQFTSPTTPSVTANLTFDVTVVSIPSGVSGTGIALTGVSGVSATSVTPYIFNSGTLTNSTNTFKTVVYRITPKLNGCTSGPFKDVSIDIEPTPVVSFTNNKPNICTGDSPDILITSSTVPTNAADLKFDITVNAQAGISGTGDAFNGVNNVSAGFIINTGTLFHNNLSNSPLTVTYTITPKLDNANGCPAGTPQTVVVTVRPNPIGVNSTTISPAKQVCSREAFTYNIQTENIDIAPGNGVTSNFTFTVSSSDEANVPTPLALDRSVASSAQISGNFTNRTGSDVFITYRISAFNVLGNCSGTPFDVVVAIHPEPKASTDITVLNIEKCSGESIDYQLQDIINETTGGGNTVSSVFSYSITSVTPSGNDLTPAVFPGSFGRDFASRSAAKITETFFNRTSHDVTINYQVTPYSASNNCAGTPFTFKVVYHPEPVGTNLNEPNCDLALNHDIQATQITNGLPSVFTYTISQVPLGALTLPADRTLVDRSDDPITDTYVNLTGAPVVVTYTITAYNKANPSCASPNTFTYSVTINPKPTAVGGTLAAKCSDETITINPQTFVTNIPPVTITKFNWKVTYPSGVTGLTGTLPPSGTITNGATSPISFTMNNIRAGQLSVTIEITPFSGDCVGTPFTVIQPIDAEPVMATNLNTSRCSGVAYGINLATNGVYTAGPVTFDVFVDDVPTGLTGTRTTNTVTPIGGGNSAANVIFNDSYTNQTATPLIVKYRVVPKGGGCSGDAKTIQFTIIPEPVLLIAAPPDMCSTNANSPTITNIVLGTDGISVNAQTYRIDNIQYDGNPSPPAGFTFPGTNKDLADAGDINLIKNDQFNNKTANPVVVRYTLTPISAGGCSGAQGTVSITVNPEPVLDPALSPTPVCSNEVIDPAGGVDFTLKSVATSGAAKATSFIIRSINTNGLTAALTNASIGVPLGPDGIDNDRFINTISSSFVNVIYTIAPVSAAGCVGEDQTVTVQVNPAPALKSGLDKIVCNGASSTIVLADNSPTSAPANQYKIVSVTVGPTNTLITPGATVLGLTASATNIAVGITGGVNLIANDKYTNATTERIIVKYTIEAASLAGCAATGAVTLIVEPSIVSAATLAANNICSGEQIDIRFGTPTYANGDPANPIVTYSYSMIPVSGITGNTIGNNLTKSAGVDIDDQLVNSTNNPIPVTYRIIPKASAASSGLGCTGVQENIIITVQPRPKVNAINNKTICEGTTVNGVYTTSPVNLNMVSPTSPLTGSMKFFVTVAPSSANLINKATNITNFTTGVLINNLTLLADEYENNGSTAETVTFTIEPRNVDASNVTICSGPSISVVVTINPRPTVTVIPGALSLCSGDTFNGTMTTDTDLSNPGSTLVSWTVAISSTDIVGASKGVGDEIFQTLVNKGKSVQTVTYKFSGSLNGCPGNEQTIVVTVNPMPSVTPPAKVSVCGGSALNLDLRTMATTDPTQTTFEWVVTDVNGIGTANQFDGSGTGINQTFVNNTNSQATLIYQITPIGPGGCKGIEKVMNVSVAPTIVGGFVSVDEGVCEGTPIFLTFELQGQAPFDFVYSATANGITVNKTITKSGNVKVEKVTPTITTAYEIVSIKDALGCNVTLSPKPKVTITVYKKITANWIANVPPFIGGTSAVGFTNGSNPLDESIFRYEWDFGTDNSPSPTTATGIGPFTVNYNRPGDHFVSMRAVNIAAEAAGQNCESTFASRITIPVLPLTADFKFTPKAACFPQNITVTENTATGDVMDWRVIDNNGRVAATSAAALPVFLISTPGKYTITLKTSNSLTGQVAFAPTTGKDVSIYENPVASFDVRPTLVYVPDTELTTFNFSTGAPEYLWDFGDGGTSTEQEPKYFYKVEGSYDITLIAINDHADGAVCSDTLTRKVIAKQGGLTKVPNAFTPSALGPSGGQAGNNTFNDVFLPIVKGAEEFNMQVFDRWGNLLFESNNSNIGWDGYNKDGKLMPAGVYVYKLTVRLSDGQRSTQIGDITMIR